MPPAPKHNWAYLYEVFQKLSEENPDISYAEFARQNGVDEGACRAAFNRKKNKQARRTLRTEIGRTDGRTTPSIFDDVSPEEASEIIKQVSSGRVVAVHAKVLEVLHRSLAKIEAIQKKSCEQDENGDDKIKIETIRDVKDGYQAEGILVGIMREIMPFILELKDRAGLAEILSKLQGRVYDVTQAALEISKMGANLPEALRIMLAKTPPIVIATNFDAPSEDDLDQRALEALQRVKWQHDEFLPERRQEVIELKQELRGVESFAPEPIGKIEE